MTVGDGRRLVVDASVARSAGVTDHPISTACRTILDSIRGSKMRIVMGSDLRREWRAHRSIYSQTWLTSMHARRQVVDVGDPKDPPLRTALECCADHLDCPADQKQAISDAMDKDVHLVEAAQASDRSVIAWDEKVRGYFRICATHVAALREIVWVNPAIKDERPTAWIAAGAPTERYRMLGF